MNSVPQRDYPGTGVVRLLDEPDIPAGLLQAFRSDLCSADSIRNLTRAVASSRPTWQAAVRAEQMFATFLKVDRQTQAILCTFVSVLNNSRYCIDDCAGSALEFGVKPIALYALPHATAAVFGDRVMSFLRYAYWVVARPHDIPAEVISQLRAQAGDEEILEVTTIVSMKCFWNHFVSALSIPLEHRCKDPDLLNALCLAATGSVREPGSINETVDGRSQ